MAPSSENPTEGTMQDDTHMTLAERRKYLGRMRPRYLLATRAEQTRLLSEMEGVTGTHRKSLLIEDLGSRTRPVAPIPRCPLGHAPGAAGQPDRMLYA